MGGGPLGYGLGGGPLGYGLGGGPLGYGLCGGPLGYGLGLHVLRKPTQFLYARMIEVLKKVSFLYYLFCFSLMHYL